MLIEKNLLYNHNVIIYFVHIPKSGGTTVREGLRSRFNEDEYISIPQASYSHYLSVKERKTESKTKTFLKRIALVREMNIRLHKIGSMFKPAPVVPFYSRKFYSLRYDERVKLRLIASHMERNRPPSIMGKDYFYVMSIRDPLQRIQSYYFYTKKNDTGHKPYILAARKYGIDDFVQWMFDHAPFMVRNPYCRCVTGAECFEEAKATIDNEFYLAAPIERLDDFCRILTRQFFGEAVVFQAQRINSDNPKEVAFSDKTVGILLERNNEDIKLKEHVAREFSRIFSHLHQRPPAVDDFNNNEGRQSPLLHLGQQ